MNRLKSIIQTRLGNRKLLDIIMICILGVILVSHLPYGHFVDEEEKITAAIFSSQGMLPYKDVLVNHGPLMYFIAIAGYAINGTFTSFIALRITPLLCALTLIWCIQNLSDNREKPLNSVQALAASIFIATIWSDGTIRMGIYHGVGGLVSSIIIFAITYPRISGEKARNRSLITLVCLSGLLLTTSATFVPFIILSAASWLITSTNTKNDQKGKILKSELGNQKKTSFYRYVAETVAISPVVLLALSALAGVITIEAIYLGHIYFNLEIFGGLKGGITVLSKPGNTYQVINLLLAAGVIIMPLTLMHQKGLYSWRNACASLTMSASVLSLGYRTGLTSLNDFHSLPYIIPACLLCIVSSTDYAKVVLSDKKVSKIMRIALGTSAAIIAIAPGIIVQQTRTAGKIEIKVDKALHLSVSKFLGQNSSDVDTFTEDLIRKIETKNGRKVELFVWPFLPFKNTWHNRTSSYPMTGYIWYMEAVEKDENLKKYHICNNPNIKDPDIILYGRWIIAGTDSNIYGQCLIEKQNKKYLNPVSGIYVLKEHIKEVMQVSSKQEYTQLTAKENWNKGLAIKSDDLKPLPIRTNKRTTSAIQTKEESDLDSISVALATYNRENKGNIQICIIKENKRYCSGKIAKENIKDNTIKRIQIKGLGRLKSGKKYRISINDETPGSNNQESQKIAIYVLSESKGNINGKVATWKSWSNSGDKDKR